MRKNECEGRKKAAARRIMLAIGLLAAMCGLSGCRLAAEEGGELLKEDELIGLYITTEYVDISGDLQPERNGKNLTGSVAEEDSDRLYAEPDGKAPQNSSRLYGELDAASGKLRFEGVEGYEFLYVTQMPGDQGEVYSANMVSDIFYHTSIDVKDQDVEMEGVIAFDKTCASRGNTEDDMQNGNNQMIFYFNPVYMTLEGEIYLTSGSGMANQALSSTEFSHSITRENTKNGVVSSGTKRFSVKIQPQTPVATAVFTQMDREGTILRRDEYSFDRLPEIYSRDEAEAYTVVMLEDASGERRYDILNREDADYMVLGSSEDSDFVISPFYMQIK